MMKVLLVSLFLAVGCSVDYGKYLAENYVGLTEKQVISRAGVPTQTYELDGTKYLVYDNSAVASTPSYYNQYTGYSAPRTYTSYCKTTFELEGGKIVSYRFEGNSCQPS